MLAAGLAALPAIAQDIPPFERQFSDGTVISFYGQFNPAILSYDDGGENTTYAIIDNDNSSTRAGVRSTTDYETWELFGNIEFEWQPRASNNVNQLDPDAYDGTFTRTNFRKIEARVSSDRLGRLWLGQGSMASDGIAESDLSGTTVIAYSSIVDTAGGNFFRRKSDGELADGQDGREQVRVKDTASNLDGLSRKTRVRYDTPSWNGLRLKASYGQDVLAEESDDLYDIAAAFEDTFDTFEIAASIGYAWDDGNDSAILAGSVSGLHTPTGLNLTFAAGQTDDDTSDPSYAYVKLGYLRDFIDLGPTAFAIDYYGGRDFNEPGSDSTSYALSAVQNLGATDLYVIARQYTYDDDLDDYEDGLAVMGGLRLRF